MHVNGHSSRRGWLTAGGWLLLLGGLAFAYAHNFAHMWHRWFPAWRRANYGLYDRIIQGESYYTHGPLIPLVSLLAACLLVRNTSMPLRPRRSWGFVVLSLGLLMHLLSAAARVSFVSGFSLIVVLAGLVLMLWGPAALRRLWFPLAFLLFMVPLPEVSIARLNFRLKELASDWGVFLANAVGIIAQRSGNQVWLEGDKTLVIANICNGLRTLISLLAFGALYAYVCRLRGLWRLGLFLMVVPVAVVCNTLRIVSLIAVADIVDVKTAAGWYHDLSGLLIYALAFTLMFSLEKLTIAFRRLIRRPISPLPLFHDVRRTDEDAGQLGRLVSAAGARRAVVAGAVLLLAGAGAWRLDRVVPSAWNMRLAGKAIPAELKVDNRLWRSYEIELDENTRNILETDDYLYRRYVCAGSPPVDLCLIFSEDNRKGTHPPDLCLEGGGQDIISKRDVVVPGAAGTGGLPCRELLVQRGTNKHYFLYTYKCGGSYTRSFWRQQFTIFVNGVLNRNASGALIRVSTPVQMGPEDARRRARKLLGAAVPHIDAGLP